jgi:hypothetical protein
VESAVLEAYEKLIRVTIHGRVFDVPENNTLLRVLQFMNFELAYTKYCWNGDCRNCAFRYVSRRTGKEVEALGCQMRCFPEMTITRLPEGVSTGLLGVAPAAGTQAAGSTSGSSEGDADALPALRKTGS